MSRAIEAKRAPRRHARITLLEEDTYMTNGKVLLWDNAVDLLLILLYVATAIIRPLAFTHLSISLQVKK